LGLLAVYLLSLPFSLELSLILADIWAITGLVFALQGRFSLFRFACLLFLYLTTLLVSFYGFQNFGYAGIVALLVLFTTAFDLLWFGLK
jgi:hypothetical protein